MVLSTTIYSESQPKTLKYPNLLVMESLPYKIKEAQKSENIPLKSCKLKSL